MRFLSCRHFVDCDYWLVISFEINYSCNSFIFIFYFGFFCSFSYIGELFDRSQILRNGEIVLNAPTSNCYKEAIYLFLQNFLETWINLLSHHLNYVPRVYSQYMLMPSCIYDLQTCFGCLYLNLLWSLWLLRNAIKCTWCSFLTFVL